MEKTLSIIIPVFNEVSTLESILKKVIEAPLPEGIGKEIIIVDDGSSDGTHKLYPEIEKRVAKVLIHEVNQGKGAALRTGIKAATGDFLIVQDADLEYDPNEYIRLIEPLLEDRADVVYGSRFLSEKGRRVLYFWHTVGNQCLTLLSNMFTDLNLTDMETCYKMFRRSVIQDIKIEENRFGFEPEITAKLAKKRVRFYEIGISYNGRTYEEGKKIGIRDLFRAVYCIIRYSVFSRSEDVGKQTLERMETYGGYADYIIQHLRPHFGDRALEFGAGIGTIAHRNLDRERLFVTEYNEGYMDTLHRLFDPLDHVSVHQMDIANPLPELLEEEIDTVYSSNVLEHIKDDEAAMDGVYQLLKPGGRFVFLVPAFPQLYSPLDRNLEHYRRYTKTSAIRKLRRAGFSVKKAYYINFVGGCGWWFAGRILRQGEISDLNILVHRIIEPVSRLVDRIFGESSPFGLSLIVIAEKPKQLE